MSVAVSNIDRHVLHPFVTQGAVPMAHAADDTKMWRWPSGPGFRAIGTSSTCVQSPAIHLNLRPVEWTGASSEAPQ